MWIPGSVAHVVELKRDCASQATNLQCSVNFVSPVSGFAP